MGETEVEVDKQDERPPLGSWAKTYAVTVVCAVACIALLYWFTATFNIPWPRD